MAVTQVSRHFLSGNTETLYLGDFENNINLSSHSSRGQRPKINLTGLK